MRLLNESKTVSVTIWQTYCEGYVFDDAGNPTQMKEVILANVKSERAAENYLRSKMHDSHIIVTRISRVRGKWRAPIDEFLSIAELVSESN